MNSHGARNWQAWRLNLDTHHSFTPVGATKMLPLVRRIMADVTLLGDAVAVQRRRLHVIDQLPGTMDEPNYREEVSDIRRTLEADEQRLDDCLNELSALGLEVHLPIDGSVDFPAVLNRRAVRLCWHPDDEQVQYWHEVGQGRESSVRGLTPRNWGQSL